MFSFRQLRTTIDHVSLLNVKDTLKSICMILFFSLPLYTIHFCQSQSAPESKGRHCKEKKITEGVSLDSDLPFRE